MPLSLGGNIYTHIDLSDDWDKYKVTNDILII